MVRCHNHAVDIDLFWPNLHWWCWQIHDLDHKKILRGTISVKRQQIWDILLKICVELALKLTPFPEIKSRPILWQSNRYGKEGVRGQQPAGISKQNQNMSPIFPHHDLSRDSEVEWCWCLISSAFQPFQIVSVPAWNYCFYCINQVNTLNSIGHLPYSYPFFYFFGL